MATTKVVLNDARVATIAGHIRGAVLAMADGQRDMIDATDTVQRLSGEIMVTKLTIASRIAEMSGIYDWLPDEIDAACKQAGKGNGDQDDERTQKSMATVCSEMRVIASPRVRTKFPVILNSCQTAWDNEVAEASQLEADERKHLEQPVHKYASRLYNLVITISRKVKDGEAIIGSTEDLVAFCKANDPDHIPSKIAARLKGIVEALDKMVIDFGHEDLTLARDYLKTITADQLKASREAMLGVAVATASVASVASAAPQTPAPASGGLTLGQMIEAASEAPEGASVGVPMAGVSDALDDIEALMNDR